MLEGMKSVVAIEKSPHNNKKYNENIFPSI